MQNRDINNISADIMVQNCFLPPSNYSNSLICSYLKKTMGSVYNKMEFFGSQLTKV